MPDSGQAYFIINKKSGTALDLSGDDQRSIIGFASHRSDNQKWRFIYHSDDNGWTIQNVYNGKYIDIPPVNPGDGTSVIAVDTPTPRRWDVFQDGDGWRIQLKNSNLDVDLSNYGNAADRTPVELWGRWAADNQIWRLEQ